ncbi:hypothetical protein HN51_037864 [Arachis hypogaea]|nr:uncharacterized protein DS421_13g432580 [Arachis hypogaea]
MAHYQNQYGAVTSSASTDPIRKEMDLSGYTAGIAANEYSDTTGGGGGAFHHDAVGVNEVEQHKHKKKGIIEKIKDKLPITHHHNK